MLKELPEEGSQRVGPEHADGHRKTRSLCTDRKAYESSVWARFVFERSHPCDQNYDHLLCGMAIQTVMHM